MKSVKGTRAWHGLVVSSVLGIVIVNLRNYSLGSIHVRKCVWLGHQKVSLRQEKSSLWLRYILILWYILTSWRSPQSSRKPFSNRTWATLVTLDVLLWYYSDNGTWLLNWFFPGKKHKEQMVCSWRQNGPSDWVDVLAIELYGFFFVLFTLYSMYCWHKTGNYLRFVSTILTILFLHQFLFFSKPDYRAFHQQFMANTDLLFFCISQFQPQHCVNVQPCISPNCIVLQYVFSIQFYYIDLYITINNRQRTCVTPSLAKLQNSTCPFSKITTRQAYSAYAHLNLLLESPRRRSSHDISTHCPQWGWQ